jgi:hypothetical protein
VVRAGGRLATVVNGVLGDGAVLLAPRRAGADGR